MIPDAEIRVRFLLPSEGGRATAIAGDQYGCPMRFKAENLECRFVLKGPQTFEPGKSYDIAVKFMNPDAAFSCFQKSRDIELWEGKVIAKGEMIEWLALKT